MPGIGSVFMVATVGEPTPKVTRGCALLLACAPDLRATEFGYGPDDIEATEIILQMEDNKSDL